MMAAVVVSSTAILASCSSRSTTDSEQSSVNALADQVWTFSQSHPEGFTLDLRTMTEPKEGIAVSHAATQGCHTRQQLNSVVSHALKNDGYVGGWKDTRSGLYFFDSTRLFDENALRDAVTFGKSNAQQSAYIISTSTLLPLDGIVAAIAERGTLLVGTTGDYRPLSFCEPDDTYWGFGIEVAGEIASTLGVKLAFVKTSWPTLTADVMAETPTFDLAIGGITITDTRRETMLMSEGYLANGKTILCRVEDTNKFRSLADIDKPEVRVMVNPGGLNEKFARANLTHATLLVHQQNEEIPGLVAQGDADVMITEITEAPYYVKTDSRLAAPLLRSGRPHGDCQQHHPPHED